MATDKEDRFGRYENHYEEWRQEENERRARRELERALINTDRDYPDSWHRRDVMNNFYRKHYGGD